MMPRGLGPASETPISHSRIADRAEATTVFLASFLAIIKAVVFAFTGSISILASCADSMLDVAASAINWLAVRAAAMPPDEDHSYGHGKFEAVAGVFQSGVVAAAAAYLLYSSIRRFMVEERLERLELGIAVMIISTIVSVIIITILKSAAERSGSVAVAGDALHYTTDVLANAATVVALALAHFTGAKFWDPLIALFLTAYLLRAALGIFVPAWDILVDRQISDEERDLIEKGLAESAPPEVVGYYGLRTRTSGLRRFADVRVVFAEGVTFNRVHDVMEEMEREISSRLGRAEVVIHPEPFGSHGIDRRLLSWERDGDGVIRPAGGTSAREAAGSRPPSAPAG